MSTLFSEFQIKDITFKNRIFMSPMCQYSSIDGMPTDWHLVHLGSRAVGGAALVMVEATGVSADGRISPADMGIWSDAHATALARIAKFVKEQGSVPGIQIAHAGRKASVAAPWDGGKVLDLKQGGWEILAPSAVAFNEGDRAPRAMTAQDIARVTDDFKTAARRALAAGFQVIEIHAAHGYLLHEFLSPLSNRRTDSYGGTISNRMRFPIEITRAVREVWPDKYPLFVRISATDWADGGWDLAQSIEFSKKMKELGVDLIDCSSGGLVPYAKIQSGPGYQVPFSEAIRKEVKIATGAVGMITEAKQAEEILSSGKADVVLLAREFLRQPYWPLHAAHALRDAVEWPKQYERGKIHDPK